MKHLFIGLVLFFIFSTSYAQLEMTPIEDLPVRLTRSFGISMDMGWNGLVGFGPTMQYFVSPRIGFDGGFGLSSTGFKLGARGRYLFLEKNFTPFVGLGFNFGRGFGNNLLELEDNGNVIQYFLEPSPFLQITAGGDFVEKGGFFILFNLGYSILLSGDNIDIQQGTPTDVQRRVLQIAYGSGIVIEVGIGYIFKNRK